MTQNRNTSEMRMGRSTVVREGTNSSQHEGGQSVLRPLHTSGNKGENNDEQLKPRTRSISPHARAILRRTFSRSRSRSRSRAVSRSSMEDDDDDCSSVSSSTSSSVSSTSSGMGGSKKQMLVAVTSCRSDAYYAQKAPGAISMLPRKAPSALKTFHELAVGMKDAYEAVGATPMQIDQESDEAQRMPRREREGRIVLWEFLDNVNFVSHIKLWGFVRFVFSFFFHGLLTTLSIWYPTCC